MRVSTIVVVGFVAAMVAWFSAAPIPVWLLVVLVAIAVPAFVRAGLAQKRHERAFLRSWWRTYTNR